MTQNAEDLKKQEIKKPENKPKDLVLIGSQVEVSVISGTTRISEVSVFIYSLVSSE